MLRGEDGDDLAAGVLLLFARGARPEDEKSLSTDFAAYIRDGVGHFAENLHGLRGLSGSVPGGVRDHLKRTGKEPGCYIPLVSFCTDDGVISDRVSGLPEAIEL